jgi:hypothetical protein
MCNQYNGYSIEKKRKWEASNAYHQEKIFDDIPISFFFYTILITRPNLVPFQLKSLNDQIVTHT